MDLIIRNNKKYIVILVIFTLVLTSAAFNLKDLLKNTAKTLAIGALIRELAEPLNKFVNDMLLNHNVGNRETTKVVPVFTVGGQSAIGAAQVSGTPELVNSVKSVFAIEDVMNGKYRTKAYIPSSSSNPLKLDRVYGVGVTAIIEGFL